MFTAPPTGTLWGGSEAKLQHSSVRRALEAALSEPDMVICLKYPDELIIERIKQRSRGNENCIDPKYFIKLNQLYEEYFAKINLPKIEVDLNEYNLLGNSACITWLSNKIDELATS